MALHLRNAVESCGGDGDVEMAAFSRTGMPDVSGAVVTDFEQRRMQRRLQCATQALDAFGAHDADSLWNAPRNTHSTMASVNTMATGGAIQTLKSTQSDSLRFSATQMFTKPSST